MDQRRIATGQKPISRLKIVLSILLLGCFVFLNGQDPYFVNYNTEDGLPGIEVYDVEVDHQGIIWLTTDRGLATYNGYEFKTYAQNDGLVDNTLFNIYRDSKERLWFTTLKGGLCYHEAGRFYAFAGNDALQEFVAGKLIRPLVFTEEGQLYFCMSDQEQNIYTYDETQQKVRAVDFDQLAEQYGLIEVDPFRMVSLDGNLLPGPEFISDFFAVEVKDYQIFTHYTSQLRQIGEAYLFSSQNGKASAIRYHVGSRMSINNIYIDHLGDAWVCTSEGLLQFENADLSKAPNVYFKGMAITSIINDFDGNYWMTTLENGVFKIPSFSIKTFRSHLNYLESELITVISVMDDHLIFGTQSGKLFSLRKGNYQLKDLTDYADKGDDKYSISFESSNGKQAFVGNYFVEDQFGVLKVYPQIRYRGKYWLENGRMIALDPVGLRYSENKVDPSRISYQNPRWPKYMSIRVLSLEETQTALWIGTISGLYKMPDFDANQIEAISTHHSILNSRINAIQVEEQEQVWLATMGNGLVLYNAVKDETQQWTTKEGVNSSLLNSLFVENDTSVWLAGNKGLNKLEFSRKETHLNLKTVKSLTTSDGLLSNYISDVALWDGYVWLATDKGIVYFAPSQIEHAISQAPFIQIQQVKTTDSLFTNVDRPQLPYHQNDVQFSYLGISNKQPEDAFFYRYRLLNQKGDTTWSYINERKVIFNDLSEGAYTFEVAAQNKFKEWSATTARFDFVISPHFSETWWFRLLMFLAAISGVMGLIMLRVRQVKRKEAQKRSIQIAKMQLVESELNALRSQMNPHFVFNSLNSIQNFIFDQDALKANHYINQFSRLMRNGLQFSRLKFISIEEEIEFLKTYLDLEEMRFSGKFTYQLYVDEQIETSTEFIPPFMFQPIVENAVKHAFKVKHRKGLIDLQFHNHAEGRALKVIITDNGIGLEAAKQLQQQRNKGLQDRSLGLSIVKNQLELLNKKNGNNLARFELLDLKTTDPTLSGVRVTLVLPCKTEVYDKSSRH